MNKLYDVCNDFSLSENTTEKFENGMMAGYRSQNIKMYDEDVILLYELKTHELHYAYGSQELEGKDNIDETLDYLQEQYYYNYVE